MGPPRQSLNVVHGKNVNLDNEPYMPRTFAAPTHLYTQRTSIQGHYFRHRHFLPVEHTGITQVACLQNYQNFPFKRNELLHMVANQQQRIGKVMDNTTDKVIGL